MAPMSRGKQDQTFRVSKIKPKASATTKNYRFEPFAQRVSRIKIKPARPNQRDKAHQNLSDSETHFRASLQKWNERNLTESYTVLTEQVEPLSQSLPQVLYHADRIVELLLEGLAGANIYSLEPILDLTIQLSYDIGPRFETYLDKVILAIATATCQCSEIQCIEWSFTALAALLRHFQRTLIYRLEHVFALVAPLMGKSRQKAFITRFAAEALSFLARKCANAASTTADIFGNFVRSVVRELQETDPDNKIQFQRSVMFMFSEAIRGTNDNVRTGASVIVQALFDAASRTTLASSILEGVLISAVHNTDASGFAPILQAVLEAADLKPGPELSALIGPAAQALFTVIGTRQGTRISGTPDSAQRWRSVVDCTVQLFQLAHQSEKTFAAVQDSLLDLAAVIIQYAPTGKDDIVDQIKDVEGKIEFLEFCLFVNDLGETHFNKFLRPLLLTHLPEFWRTKQQTLLAILPRFSQPHLLLLALLSNEACARDVEKIFATVALQARSPSNSSPENTIASASALTSLLQNADMHAPAFKDTHRAISGTIIDCLDALVQGRIGSHTDFCVTSGLQYLLAHEEMTSSHANEALLAMQHYGTCTSYLQSLSEAIDKKLVTKLPEDETILQTLISNTRSQSHDLRWSSLAMLQKLASLQGVSSKALELVMDVEGAEASLQNQRNISNNLKRLGHSDLGAATAPWLPKAVVSSCFGLLHFQLTPVWNDVCACIKSLCSASAAQEEAVSIILSWLQQSGPEPLALAPQEKSAGVNEGRNSDFECTNLARIRRARLASFEALDSAERKQISTLAAISQAPSCCPARNQAQALRASMQLVDVMEKNSRLLVPIFFDWFSDVEALETPGLLRDSDDDLFSDSSSLPQSRDPSSSRENKKLMLQLFSKFHNPRTLFKADAVHSVLMSVLSVGDAELQRNALRAILAFRNASLLPYEKRLLDLLDDARFRDELAVFVNVGEDASIIRADHAAELMPVLLRLLYGRTIARGGLKNKGGPEVRRKAVLQALSRFGSNALGQFLDIALHPLQALDLMLLTEPPQINEAKLKLHKIPLRRQLGMLKMIFQTLDSLSNIAQLFTSKVLEAVLFCTVTSARRLDFKTKNESNQDDQASLLKSVRQEGLRCITLICRQCDEHQWTSYLHVMQQELIDPRLAKLPIETAQGIAWVLRLQATWAASLSSIHLVFGKDTKIIECLLACVQETSAKDEVKIFILTEILGKALNLLDSMPASETTSPEILEVRSAFESTHAELCLKQLSTLLSSGMSREMLEASVGILVAISGFVSGTSLVAQLIETCFPLMDLHVKHMSPRLRSQILTLIKTYLPSIPESSNTDLLTSAVDKLSPLFNYFLDVKSREALGEVFDILASRLPELRQTAKLCRQMNAFSQSRLAEPDNEARMDAFDALAAKSFDDISALQWQPLLYNLIFLLKDDGQFSSTRINASQALIRLVQAAQSPTAGDLSQPLKDILLPALFKGIREPSEAVRQEHLTVLGHVAQTDGCDLKGLHSLHNADGESFFNMILHIQYSQRLKALRMLSKKHSELSATSIAKVILPLLETMLGQTDESSQNLADELIKALEMVTLSLDWARYKFLVQRMISEKTRFEAKKDLRTLGAVLSSLTLATTQKTSLEGQSTLSKSVPDSEIIYEYFRRGPLTRLRDFVHFQDEATVDLRVIAASILVKMLLTFPEHRIEDLLPPLLMDVSSVLRSKAQEARDSARKTLADISIQIGPVYFGFLVKQLQAALPRGTQLHVLSYTIHSLLVAISPVFRPGSINHAVSDLVTLALDDVLGRVAEDKEAEGFSSKMKEVRKKALGYDSMEILASMVTPEVVIRLLQPLREELSRPKARLDKLDELLRRLREGFRRNSEFADQRSLVLCYELLSETSKISAPLSQNPGQYKIVAFAFDLLRRTIDKHEDLKTQEKMAGFLPFSLRALEEGEEETKAAAMKFLSSIVKLPLPALDTTAGQLVKQSKSILDAEVSTSSPLAQAALRLSASIIRERPHAVLKKSHFTEHLAYMLSRVKPDLHEPAHSHERGRQAGAFNLLRATLGRGVIVNEVYDVMDTVREVMVTSLDHEVRASARAVYSRFILDYFPQEGKAFERQLAFMRKNLQYEGADGRKSIMEVIDFVLYRTTGRATRVELLVAKFWNAILDLSVTDANADSRRLAKILLEKLFAAADSSSAAQIRSQLAQFLDAKLPNIIRRAGYQGWIQWTKARVQQDTEMDQLLESIQADAESLQGLTKIKQERALLIAAAIDCATGLALHHPAVMYSVKAAPCWQLICHEGLSAPSQVVRAASLKAAIAFLTAAVKGSKSRNAIHEDETWFDFPSDIQMDLEQLAGIIEAFGQVYYSQTTDEEIQAAGHALQLTTRLSSTSGSDQPASLVLESLSTALRREETSIKSKVSALRLLVNVSKAVSIDRLVQTLDHLLLTLFNLTDNETLAAPLGEESLRDELIENAREALSVLRDKIGNDKFVGAMQKAQNTIKERREERRAKRRIDAVTRPEIAAQKRMRKSAANKMRRKERNEMHAGRRRGY